MMCTMRGRFQGTLAATVWLAGLAAHQLSAQDKPSSPPAAPSGTVRLPLDEIKARVLADNKLLRLAAENVQSKGHATRAMQANYFPQIIGNVVYFHFNDDLGTVLTTRG